MSDTANTLLEEKAKSLVDVLRLRAHRQPEREALTFLGDGESERSWWSYAELDCRARRIAQLILQDAEPGDRVLLAFVPSLEYVAAFYGCLYAGVVAVPTYMSRLNRSSSKLHSVLSDCEASIALTTTRTLGELPDSLRGDAKGRRLQWVAVEASAGIDEENWQPPDVDGDSIAFLQYTSGSTSAPRGVMVSHGNLLHNLSIIAKNFGAHANSQGVIWLPPYHDMGLIGGILQPIFAGFPVALMPPLSFIQRPYRWLKAITEFRATISGGPNFAFDLCVERITADQKRTLDLSTWELAFNGAEPIRPETIDRFSEAFAECGFRRESFYPCYGLAESTLLVTGARRCEGPVVRTFKLDSIERGNPVDANGDGFGHRLVSSGEPGMGLRVAIVDPETHCELPECRVGEIWISGPSVAQGYWGRESESTELLRAKLSSDEGVYLRTGDLGFLADGELFVAGRQKDLIIIRGANHYPQDIENSATESHASLMGGRGAAFAVEQEGVERLVLVHEIVDRHSSNFDEIFESIRRAIAEEHDLQVSTIVLVGHHRVAKTSSGKIQRRICRQQFESGELTGVLATWHAPKAAGTNGFHGAANGHAEVSDGKGSSDARGDRQPDPSAPLGVDFFQLILDPERLSDSAALWAGCESLSEAQGRKLERVAELSGLKPGFSLLDIGCGWGGLLRLAVDRLSARRAVGLTPNTSEAAYVQGWKLDRVEVVNSDWRHYRSTEPFDSVSCIGALEHFVPLTLRARGGQVGEYRRFFRRCRGWMTGSGKLAVETLVSRKRADCPKAYQDVSVLAKMFPHSSIPSMDDLTSAMRGLFDVVESSSIRSDYEKTLESWLANLHEHRDEILERFGIEPFERFDRYFEASLRQARGGYVDAVQMSLSPLATALDEIEDCTHPTYVSVPRGVETMNRSSAEIQDWLREAICSRLPDAGTDVDIRQPFSTFGLDSLAMVGLVGDLETWLDRSLPPTLAWDYPSIESLSRHLSGETTGERAASEPSTAAEPIAIVGMACRFPGANNLDEYWRVMIEGRDSIREIPPERWKIDDYFDKDPDAPGKMVTRWGGFVDGIDQFDPQFFGISPREAARMDPQQRMLLETSWEALESAGIPGEAIAGTKTGVFVGIGGTDYSQIYRRFENSTEYLDPYSGTGNALSIAANRISYILDLHGPSLSVDTACSSALVAIHYACQSLRNRECDLALAGGVNAILTPEVTIAFSKARMLSPDGHCKTFDADANGYVRGEGCGMVLFKRLADAIMDGDLILAVIRGTAVNQDGKTAGITAPSGPAQQECVRKALRQAGVSQDELTYIEAHGTGTPLGDPIEVQALRAVVGDRESGKPVCHLGSIKSNIGHLETASGVAGLIRVVLMMQHGVIPPQKNFQKLNPHIKLDGSPIRIATEPVEWVGLDDHRLVAGVSGFGFGGTNAHLIVEYHRPPERKPATVGGPARPVHLMPVTAQSEAALREQARNYSEYVEAHPEWSVEDISFSAGTTRTAFDHRLVVVASDRDELRERLAAFADQNKATGMWSGSVKLRSRPRIAMLFTGQGSQYSGMAKALYETQPTFRRALDQCDEILSSHLDERLLAVIFDPSKSGLLDETMYTQPALFAVEYSLAELWRSWGVEATHVHGHSVGEYAAACYAGVMSLEDGLRLIAERARRMQSLPTGGKMAVVFAPEAAVREAIADCQGAVCVATINGPENTVISGDGEAVSRAVARFEEDGVRTQWLTVSHAFHSHLLDPMLDGFQGWADRIVYRPPMIPLISNVTGDFFADGTVPNGRYWRDHARGAVRFADGMAALARARCDVYLEVGPHPSLVAMGRRCVPPGKALWAASLRKGSADWEVLSGSVAALFVQGVKIDWRGWDRDYTRRRVSLPTYSFQRKRFWMEEDPEKRSGISLQTAGTDAHPLLGTKLPLAVAHRVYSSVIHLRATPSLKDHVVQGSVVLPGAAYVDAALAAAEAEFGKGLHSVENITFQQVLFLEETRRQPVQVVLSPEVAGTCGFTFLSLADGGSGWTVHASGTLKRSMANEVVHPTREIPHEIREDYDLVHDRDELYGKLAARSLEYGPLFRPTEYIWKRGKETLARMSPPEGLVAELGKFHMHPAILDGCIQILGAAIPEEYVSSGTGETYIPTGVRQARQFGPAEAVMWVHAQLHTDFEAEGLQLAQGDVWLLNEDGQVLVELSGVTLTRIGTGRRVESGERIENWIHEMEWEELGSSETTQPSIKDSNWLVVSDGNAVAGSLAHAIAAKGAVVRLVGGDDLNGIETALATESYTHVVCLSEAPIDGDCVSTRALDRAAWLLRIVQLLDAWTTRRPMLVIATVGSQAVVGEDAVSIAGSELWGLGRVIANERPELRTKLVDLDTKSGTQANGARAASELIDEVVGGESENQVAIRSGRRYGARLVRRPERIQSEPSGGVARQQATPPEGVPYRLEVGSTPTLDRLSYRPFARRPPAAGEVEVEVAATGLNFSDVLKAMGLYPGLKPGAVPIGIECSGRVTAVGDGVSELSVDDEVMGVAPFSFASHATTSPMGLVRKPAGITHEEAATIPIPYLTAYYGLHYLARVEPGEKVLIHAAAGGVGLAAIQICQAVGAEVFATAGSDEKREYLRSLGVAHVMNSRTLDFAAEIARITEGRGVDIVLNSLPGEAIAKSIECLGAYGRFLEIGKTDIYQNRAIGLYPFQNNLSYFAIDLDKMLREKPELVRRMFLEIVDRFECGEYRPLPKTVFDADQTVQAFRYMAQRKNTGKVIVRYAIDRGAERAAAAGAAGTYWITGGLGALGLETAKWLCRRGAKHLVLFGRREPSESARTVLDEIRATGVHVELARADVGDRQQLLAAIGKLPPELARPVGVYHAAGVLDDGVIGQQTRDRFERVMRPKAAGAWNLHEATLEAPVEEFVLFSSVASILGSPGQSNYAAGNAFLDGLAAYRRSRGLPGLSINWGPWAEVGMAARLGEAKMSGRGIEPLPPSQAMEAMERLVESDAIQTAVLDVAWDKVLSMYPAGPPEMLKGLAEGAASRPAGDRELRKRLLDSPAEERHAMLQAYFLEQIAKVMELDAGKIDPEQPMNTLGLDSLMAIELKNGIESSLSISVPMAKFLEGPSASQLATMVLELLGGPIPATNAKDSKAEPATA